MIIIKIAIRKRQDNKEYSNNLEIAAALALFGGIHSYLGVCQ